ncbi:MAG: NfeD family protein [Erysipelotrichaceae bacterium]|nr:NfeD family protein [Erysipelotrichaceae bacterium]MDD3810183.1 NfeD family protein [Erysipelotrichaceae bacterium]
METTFWLIVIILAVIIEAATVDLVSIWFGLGAIFALVLELFGVSTPVQIIVFVLVTVFSLFVTRPIAKRYLKTNTVATNYDRYIGKHALVLSTISPDQKGEVKVMASTWAASSIDNTIIEEGEYCEVIGVEGAHLVVKKLSNERED